MQQVWEAYGKAQEPVDSIVHERTTSVIAKTGCKASLVLKEENGEWVISSVDLEHNHILGPCTETRFFRTHKFMSDEEKDMIKTLKKVNTPTRNIVAILSNMRGGRTNLSYDDKDVAKYSYKVGRERTMNDMTQMLKYFSEKQAENPGFYYSVDMEAGNKVRNIFWVDAKAREYYATYGDCISYDTTFLTNKYNLPFAPIVGVSAHGNTYLFACAFLGDETAETFSWVFEQFLKAMNGKHPVSIVTDQDGAMMKAIKQTLPNTRHRNCWFHIKKTLEEKLFRVYPKHKGLYEEMNDIMDSSVTEREFEELWPKMMSEFNLHHIKYLGDIWEKRKRFIPVYFKNDFFPFIQSTARSEGTNSVFKRGVGPQFSVTSFLNEYQRISDTIHNREDRHDYHTRNRKRKILWSKYHMKVQVHEMYNKAIFVKFQKELRRTTALQLDEIEMGRTYEVYIDPNQENQPHRLRKYIVLVDIPGEEYNCLCCKFQKDSVLCSHVLKVMLHLKIKSMPEKYIIDRWRRNEKKMASLIPELTPAENSTLRFNMLARRLVTIASKGSKCKKRCEYLLAASANLERELDAMDLEDDVKVQLVKSHGHSRVVKSITNGTIHEQEGACSFEVKNPEKVKAKGRPRKTRMKTIVEEGKEKAKKKRGCKHCGDTTHTFKDCPNKHEYKKQNKRRKVTPSKGEQKDNKNAKLAEA